MSTFLAHTGGQTPLQKGVETLLLLAAVALGWAAIRLRDVRLFGRARIAGWAVGLVAAAALVLAFLVPSMFAVKIASVRPSTNAKVMFLSPMPGQVLVGDPAAVRVWIRVAGARIVTGASTHLVSDKGHVHLYLDGTFLTSVYGPSTTFYAFPGIHRLKAEFMAVDHGPFSPPVTATVSFEVDRVTALFAPSRSDTSPFEAEPVGVQPTQAFGGRPPGLNIVRPDVRSEGVK